MGVGATGEFSEVKVEGEECIEEEEQEAEGDRDAHTPQTVTPVLHAGSVGKKVTLHATVRHRELLTQND